MTNTWSSTARARSSSSQWAGPVAVGEGGRNGHHRGPGEGQHPVELGKPDVVAEASGRGRRRRRLRHAPSRGSGTTTTARRPGRWCPTPGRRRPGGPRRRGGSSGRRRAVAPSGPIRQLVLASRPSRARPRSGKLPATRWMPTAVRPADDAQVDVGPSSGSAPARSTSGVPATEKYSGRTTSPAPAAAASSTRTPAAARLAVRSSPAVVWMAATRMSQGRPVIGHNDPRRSRPTRTGPASRK